MPSKHMENLERTQKSFVKLISKNKFDTENENAYENCLAKLNLQTLEQRRKLLSLTFAKNSTNHEKLKDLFTKKENFKNTRNPEKYDVPFANTDRMKNSSIIYMQNLLNSHEQL